MLFFLFPIATYAQQDFSEDMLEQGVEAFQNMNFAKAISCLSPIEDSFDELDDDSKATLAFILGTCYLHTDNYKKARIMFEIVKTCSPSDKRIFIQILPSLLSVYSELKDEAAETTCYNEIITLFNNNEFIETGYYTDYAVSLTTYLQEKNNYALALDIAKKGLSVIDNEDMDDRLRGLQKNTLYMALGNSNRELQNYRQAVLDYKNALKYISYTQNVDESDALSGIGNCFEHAEMPDSALVYLEKAERLYQLRGDATSRPRIINSLELGVTLSRKGENLKAQEYLKNAEKGFELLQDNELLPYVYVYLYQNSKDLGNQELINKYSDLIKQYIKTVKEDNSRTSKICFSTYASILESEGQIQKAIGIMNEVVDNENNDQDTPITSRAASISKQASLYMKAGDFVQAEKEIRSSIKLLDPIKQDVKSQYVNDLTILAEILTKTNRVGEGIKELENIEYLVIESKDDNIIASYYDMLTSLYGDIGNYDKLLEYRLLNRDIKLRNIGENSYPYAVSLIKLSEAYAVSQQKEKGKECLDQASQIIIRLYGENSKEYYDVLHKQSSYIQSNEDGKKHFEKRLSLSKKLFGKNSIQYGEDLCWYSLFLMYQLEDHHAIDVIQEGLNILKGIDGYDRYSLFFLGQLSAWYHVTHDYENAYAVDKEYFNKSKTYISDNFPNLVDWQRESLWSPIREHLVGFISAASETNSSLYLKLAYNSLLLGKGLLLQSTNNITNAIRQSGDNELISIHEQLQLEKAKLLRIEKAEDAVDIRNNINRLQRVELNRVNQTDVINDLFDIDWTDVRDGLKEGDVAIEFVSFPTQDCISYAALVLNSHSQEPQCIPLFNDKELMRYYLDDNVEYDYTNPDLYRVIWDRLETYALKNATNVYFAPDGLLNKIAIESLVDKQGIYASDKWSLHRLTSTREIVHSSTHGPYKSAVLYGGLTYSMDAEDLAEVARLRSGVKNLAETKEEIMGIQTLLKDQSVDCKLKTGEMGTEESFMSLSSTGVNVLHLATHGFFWTKENVNEYSKVQFMSLIDDTNLRENALLRSGLLLSGANIALQGRSTSQGIQDGILTAHEIASLDFGDLDLVVLSACQTALGEISGDGVFGLQRGFKLAGAQSMLMSLWKVDDTSTRVLMNEFYKQLLSGQSKSNSLKNAQKMVRSMKGLENPEYWAGFILIDAIN